MTSTLRNILGAALLSAGSLAGVLIVETPAFADGPVCDDNGCWGLGSYGRDCHELDGQQPCLMSPGADCSCRENPLNNYGCYCHASVS